MDASIENKIIDGNVKRCFKCIYFREIFKIKNKKLVLKFEPSGSEDFFRTCKHGIEKIKGGKKVYVHGTGKSMYFQNDNYETYHKLYCNKSPHDSDPNLEDDSTLGYHDHIEHIINKKTSMCENYVNRFKKSINVKFTQLGLPSFFPNLYNSNKEIKAEFLNKVFKIKCWSTMNRENGIWVPLTYDRKQIIKRKLKDKFTFTGWIFEIIKKIENAPFIVKPKTPIVDILWYDFSSTVKEFYKKWNIVGDKQIYKELGDNILKEIAPENTEEYINLGSYKGKELVNGEWIRKKIINTRKNIHGSNLLKEKDLDNINNSSLLWFNLNENKLSKEKNMCSFCNISTKNNTTVFNVLKSVCSDEFYWITSRCDITKLCINHLEKMRNSYRELIRRGIYNSIDPLFINDNEEEY